MRKAILIVFSVLLAHSGVAFADLDDGLVAHYTFSGDAVDETGNGHDGDVQGATLVEDRFGNPNSAYSFEALDAYINVNASVDFQLTSWSIAGWIFINQYGTTIYSANIIRKLNNPNMHYNFAISYWGNTNLLGSAYETCDSENDHTLFYGGLLPLQKWIFFCSIRDASTGRHGFYVNGNEIDEFWLEAIWSDIPCTTNDDLRIGCTFDTNTESFNGVIDDIRIYNRALSEPEIHQLFNEGTNLRPSASAGDDQVVCSDATATLDGSESSDEDGTIISYLWEADLDEDGICETEIGNEVEASLTPEDIKSFGLTGKITKIQLMVTDNGGLSDIDTMLLAVAPCEHWPQPNGDLAMTSFRITHYKRASVTTAGMSGFMALPDLSLGDTVECRVTIELFDALAGGGDCVLSEGAMLNVNDRKWRLVISK